MKSNMHVMTLSCLFLWTHAFNSVRAGEPDEVRLVGGASTCAGRLELKHGGQWRAVDGRWNLKSSSVVCRQLGCGSVGSIEWIRIAEDEVDNWWVKSSCDGSESALSECAGARPDDSQNGVEVTCSESVRLVNGTSLCSGRVEVKSDQSWVSVCEGDFNQQDAEVVCRELGCGAPSALQVALYGETTAPVSTKEFQCKGSESVLRDCGTSDSTRDTCSPDKTVGLTCSEPDDVRLVGGINHCTGRLEIKHQGEWRPVNDYGWKSSSVVCRQLNCGSAISTKRTYGPTERPVWWIRSSCEGTETSLRECGINRSSNDKDVVEVVCSESVRLVNGTSLCSGRVEVKSDQSWVSVCEGDFNQQDAEVVCRELGCGAPSELQEALYGEGKPPTSTRRSHCKGTESVLLECGTTDSTTNTCSPVGLTCSEPDDIRLVGGTSHCSGILEMKDELDWRPLDGFDWNLKSSFVVCRQLGCGAALSSELIPSTLTPAFKIWSSCDGSESALSECGTKISSTASDRLEVICSESVRLVNGTSLCSGRAEVKSDQSWVSVCEGDFNQQDAEVVCRELGCGAPSALQGALYGEATALVLSKQFQCKGSESALRDCETSDSTRDTCSPDNAVGLTCLEPADVRLVGGTSDCAGKLEVKHQGEWRPVDGWAWKQTEVDMRSSSVVCRQLGCGSAVSTKMSEWKWLSEVPVWWSPPRCLGHEPTLRECGLMKPHNSTYTLELICSDNKNHTRVK